MPAALERQRWFLTVFGALFAVFARIALLMASAGAYAVVAQSTLRRTRDIGIRNLTLLVPAGIGLFACWLPARRASRINPTGALRTE